jgi:hypothetical protein
MTLSINVSFAILAISNTQHNNTLYRVPFCRVSHVIYCYAECRQTECHFAECRGASIKVGVIKRFILHS